MNIKSKFDLILNDKRFTNSFWMIIEKSISLFGLVFIISAMAKYMGPKSYGYLALATSIFLIVKSISQLGIDQIYFKHISKGNVLNNIFLKNAVILIAITYALMAFLILMYFKKNIPVEEYILFAAVGVSMLFLSVDIRAIHLDAILQTKINVVCNIFGLVVSLILRYLIIKYEQPIYYLSFPIVILTLLPFVIRWFFFKYKKPLIEKNNSLKYFKGYSLYIFMAGVPLVISVLSVNIYLQSANFMLAHFHDIESVGKYSVSMMLASSWYFLPTTFILSFLPKIYATKNNNEYLIESAKILRYLCLVVFFIIIVLYFLSGYVVLALYGLSYVDSILPFKVLLISNFFSIIGFFFYRLIVKFSGYSFLAKKMLVTCIFNLFLAYFLVREYGLLGAALASLITEFVSNLIFNLFYRKIQLLKILKLAFWGK